MATLSPAQTTFLTTANATISGFQTTVNGYLTPIKAQIYSLYAKNAYLQATYSSSDVNCVLTADITSAADLLFSVQGALSDAVSVVASIVSIANSDPSLTTGSDATTIENAGKDLELIRQLLSNILTQKQNTVSLLTCKTSNLQLYNAADPNCNLMTEANTIASVATQIQNSITNQTLQAKIIIIG